MEAIHCQRCGIMPSIQPMQGLRYLITNCQHILCGNCANGCNSQCPVCSRNCNMMELNSQACAQVKALFGDPSAELNGALKKSFQIQQFQRQLHKSSLKALGKCASDLKAAKVALTNENNILKSEKASLIKKIEELTAERNDWQMKFNQMQSAGNTFQVPAANSQLQASASSDPLNLFGNPKPNALVEPMQNQNQFITPGFTINRSPAGMSTSSTPPLRGLFPPTPSTGSASATPSSSFMRTPSPYFRNSARSFEMGSRENSQQLNGTPSRTPELIQRLRSLKCKPGSTSASRY